MSMKKIITTPLFYIGLAIFTFSIMSNRIYQEGSFNQRDRLKTQKAQKKVCSNSSYEDTI